MKKLVFMGAGFLVFGRLLCFSVKKCETEEVTRKLGHLKNGGKKLLKPLFLTNPAQIFTFHEFSSFYKIPFYLAHGLFSERVTI